MKYIHIYNKESKRLKKANYSISLQCLEFQHNYQLNASNSSRLELLKTTLYTILFEVLVAYLSLSMKFYKFKITLVIIMAIYVSTNIVAPALWGHCDANKKWHDDFLQSKRQVMIIYMYLFGGCCTRFHVRDHNV